MYISRSLVVELERVDNTAKKNTAQSINTIPIRLAVKFYIKIVY